MNRNNPFESLESRVLMSFTPLGGIVHLPSHVTPVVVSKLGTGSSTSTGMTAPTVKAQVLTHTEVLLTWTASTGVTTGYTIQRSSNGTSGWNNIGTTAVGGRSFVNSGLAAKKAYFYRIVAAGTGGAVAFSNVVEVNTL